MIQSPAGYQGDVRVKRYLDFYQAGYGVAMLSSGVAFSPLSLFAQGEPGGWYDPSDLTTLFQDAAGTTPVTAVEQPVGLVLDKSKNGVGMNGSRRYNLLSWTEDNTNAVWVKVGVGVSANTAVAPDGSTTADTMSWGGGGGVYIQQNVSLTAGQVVVWSAWVRAASGTQSFRMFGDDTISSSDLTASTSWQRFSFSYTVATGGAGRGCGFSADNAGTAFNGFVWGAQLEVGSTPTTYQRITADWPSTMSGNHLSQSTSTARPVLSARVNLLTRTEEIGVSPWGLTKTTVSANAATAPNGTLTADALIETVTTGKHDAYIPGGNATAVGQSFTFSAHVKQFGSARRFTLLAGFGVFEPTQTNNGASFDLPSQTVISQGGNVTAASITSVGDGWYRVSCTMTALGVGAFDTLFCLEPSNSTTRYTTYTGDGTSGILLWGVDLRPSNAGVGLPSYQRVGAATDYDTTGFPLYLKFDGTDDSLSSGSIDFTSTDKMSVFAGLRKLSDSAYSIVAELSSDSNSNAGSFYLAAPGSAAANYEMGIRGATNIAARVATTYTPPISNVLAVSYDIAATTFATEIIPRINASTPGTITNAGTQTLGGGNFGNHPLFIGRRNNASGPFNGHLYSFIIRGALTDAATIASTETWVNSKTGAY